MQFFMVTHYYYDGCGRADMDDVIPCSSSEKGMDYLKGLYKELDEYDWETDGDGFQILIKRGPGQYAYDYYYLQKMTMDEEL